MIRVGVLLLSLLFAIGARAAPIENSDGFWGEWSDATFARAAAEKKFVVVSLQSWWCRWCHVMNRETWSNAGSPRRPQGQVHPGLCRSGQPAGYLAAL